MTHAIRILGAALLVTGFAVAADSPDWREAQRTGRDLWAEYVRNPDNHSHLPNVSFAGYKRGEVHVPELPVVVDIRDFGGDADGETPNDIPVQDAIDAAWQRGGGVVHFPAGTYNFEHMILLHRDGVVLRGDGKGETIFHFERPLLEVLGRTGHGTQQWNWTGGLLWIGPREHFRLNCAGDSERSWSHQIRYARPVDHDERDDVSMPESWETWGTVGAEGILAHVRSSHQAGTRVITVDDASQLQRGDLVIMSWQNDPDTHALYREMAGHEAFDDTGLFDGRLKSRLGFWSWPVEIEAVDGEQVTLKQPIRLDIKPEYEVAFRQIGADGSMEELSYGGRRQALSPVVQQAGVEDLTIRMANTSEELGYNQGDGWNGIFFNRAYNAWARNVEILNAETSINVSSSKNVSIRDIDVDSPYPAKYAFTNRVMSHDVLYDNFTVSNTARVANGINTEWLSSGNVWSRGDMRKGTFDSHRMMAFDYVRTDIALNNPANSRPGGHRDAGPFTGRRAAHWNITVRDSDRDPDSRGRWVYDPAQFTRAALIGIQGADKYEDDDPWGMPGGDKDVIIGDEGRTPYPANLYEAQVEHRLQSEAILRLDTPPDGFYATRQPVVLRGAGHPKQGRSIEQVRFYLGDERLGTVTENPYHFEWTEPEPGRHTVELEMVDSEGETTRSQPYDIIIGQRQRIEHDDPRITYSGGWSTESQYTESGHPRFSEGKAKVTNDRGAYAEVTFRGTRLRWVTGRNGQNAQIKLNGEIMGEVGFSRVAHRNYNATVWDSGTLPDEEHTVRIHHNSGTLTLDHFVIDSTEPRK